mgnify:CR=1 FL=1
MNDLRARRLAGLSSKDRAEFDAAYERARLAIEVGEQVRRPRGGRADTARIGDPSWYQPGSDRSSRSWINRSDADDSSEGCLGTRTGHQC